MKFTFFTIVAIIALSVSLYSMVLTLKEDVLVRVPHTTIADTTSTMPDSTR